MTTAPYDVTITLGSYSFTVHSSDAAPAIVTTEILDGLTFGWSRWPDESNPYPNKPGRVTCGLGVIVDDVANLADLELGDPLHVVASSGGTRFASFFGRIADMTATPAVWGTQKVTRFALSGVDYTADMAEYSMEVPSDATIDQGIGDRFIAVNAAIRAFDGLLEAVSASGAAAFDGQTFGRAAGRATGEEFLDEVLRSYVVRPAASTDPAWLPAGRMIRFYDIASGAVSHWRDLAVTRNEADPVALPGRWSWSGGVLGITFPADTPRALPASLCYLDSAHWTRQKALDPNTIGVSYDGGNGVEVASTAGTGQTVRADLDSILVYQADAELLAEVYLGDPAAGQEWHLEPVTFRASEAIAALQTYPFLPDPESFHDSAWNSPAVIHGLDPAWNLSGRDWIAGIPAEVAISITGGLIFLNVGLLGLIPRQLESSSHAGSWSSLPAGPTWADTGDLTWYETRLVRSST